MSESIKNTESIIKSINDALKKISKKERKIAFLTEVEDLLIEEDNHDLIYDACRFVKGINTEKLAKFILKKKDIPCCYLLIKDVKQLEKMQDDFARVILESKDPKYNYLFVENIKGANINQHAEVVIDSKNAKANYLFAKNIEGVNIAKHASAVRESKDPQYNYLFARDVEGANILKHGAVIKESGNNEYIEKYETELSVSDFVENVKQHILNYKKKN